MVTWWNIVLWSTCTYICTLRLWMMYVESCWYGKCWLSQWERITGNVRLSCSTSHISYGPQPHGTYFLSAIFLWVVFCQNMIYKSFWLTNRNKPWMHNAWYMYTKYTKLLQVTKENSNIVGHRACVKCVWIRPNFKFVKT